MKRVKVTYDSNRVYRFTCDDAVITAGTLTMTNAVEENGNPNEPFKILGMVLMPGSVFSIS